MRKLQTSNYFLASVKYMARVSA